jgi:hypothetical protein
MRFLQWALRLTRLVGLAVGRLVVGLCPSARSPGRLPALAPTEPDVPN